MALSILPLEMTPVDSLQNLRGLIKVVLSLTVQYIVLPELALWLNIQKLFFLSLRDSKFETLTLHPGC